MSLSVVHDKWIRLILETRFENKGYGKGDVDIDFVQNWKINKTLLVLGTS